MSREEEDEEESKLFPLPNEEVDPVSGWHLHKASCMM
jgi:hypothetical protein